MGVLLPALQQPLLDEPLLQLDRFLFGETPAVLMAPLLSPATSNWFSFFYYSYLWLMGFNVIGSCLLDRDIRRMGEILSAAALVGVVGHICYVLVPGVGPYAHMTFAQPIPPSFWWAQVESVVKSSGAMLDIFPSLHTAYPLMFALHALRHRRTLPYRFIWPVSVFFAANIIFSTMFLRWHYAVDVVAGIALACGTHRFGIWYMSGSLDRGNSRQPLFESMYKQPPPSQEQPPPG